MKQPNAFELYWAQRERPDEYSEGFQTVAQVGQFVMCPENEGGFEAWRMAARLYGWMGESELTHAFQVVSQDAEVAALLGRTLRPYVKFRDVCEYIFENLLKKRSDE